MTAWIDFKVLRSNLKFEEVLKHYGVEIKKKGEQHVGFCPLPKHQGNKNSPSFSAHLERGIFHCFGCQAKGNLLDFAVLMDGGHPDDGAAVRKTAKDLQAKFKVDAGKPASQKKPEVKAKESQPAQMELNVVVNMPLDFELKGLDPKHPYLFDRGFTEETIAHFGLGYCSRGLLAGRVAIPLHNAQSQLIGYAGRVVDDKAITEENPRYRLPGKREREGKVMEFKKTLFLYNGFRFKAPADALVVVEGFPSVWWLTQNGFPNVVATMGSECSDEQADLIVSMVNPDGRVWVMPDGDKAGELFGNSLVPRLALHRFVRWARLESGKQPTDLSGEELNALGT